MRALDVLRQAQRSVGRSLGIFVRDVGNGMLEVGHNALALLGLAVVALVVFAAGRADLRHNAERFALDWLQSRHEVRAEQSGDILATVSEPDAVARATAVDPKALNREQAALAQWIVRRYKVAPEPRDAGVGEFFQAIGIERCCRSPGSARCWAPCCCTPPPDSSRSR